MLTEELAKKFNVSKDVMLTKLFELNILNKNTNLVSEFATVNKLGWNYEFEGNFTPTWTDLTPAYIRKQSINDADFLSDELIGLFLGIKAIHNHPKKEWEDWQPRAIDRIIWKLNEYLGKYEANLDIKISFYKKIEKLELLELAKEKKLFPDIDVFLVKEKLEKELNIKNTSNKKIKI